MPTVVIPNLDTIKVLLEQKIVPEELVLQPLSFFRDIQNQIHVQIDATHRYRFQKFGLSFHATDPTNTFQMAPNWYALVPVKQTTVSYTSMDIYLLDIPMDLSTEILAEIRRLGGTDFAFAWKSTLSDPEDVQRLYLQVRQLPFFTLGRFLDCINDTAHAVHVYGQQAKNLWVALGYQHPLADKVTLPSGQNWLISSRGHWQNLDVGPFQKEPENWICSSRVHFATDSRPISLLPIPLRLQKDHATDYTELWLFPQQATQQFSEIIRKMDENQVARFQFAVGQCAGKQVVLLRCRGKQISFLIPESLAFRSMFEIKHLYVPIPYRLHPTLRRDVLREQFAQSSEQIVWLHPEANGTFQIQSIPLSQFQPLKDWVQYATHPSKSKKLGWQSSSSFEVERFEVVEPVSETIKPAASTVIPTVNKPVRKSKSVGTIVTLPIRMMVRLIRWLRKRNSRAQPVQVVAEMIRPGIPIEKAVETALRPLQERLALPEPELPLATQERIRVLEGYFLDHLGELASNQRRELWPQLAGAYKDAGNFADAANCFLHALWEDQSLSVLLARGLFVCETRNAKLGTENVAVLQWMKLPVHSSIVRAVAAYSIWAALQKTPSDLLVQNVSKIFGYLEEYESLLPIRLAWLSRLALARLQQGDVLNLARTHDRLLERLLHTGLSLDLDTPSFLRFLTEGKNHSFQMVRKWLTEKRELVQEWIQKFDTGGTLQNVGMDAEIPHTKAYADLIWAWGLARLGEKQSSERLQQLADRTLRTSDPVHQFLRAAYHVRISQAREGNHAHTTLPPELQQRLQAMPETERYGIDKLMEFSRLLQPTERITAYWASTFRRSQGSEDLQAQMHELPSLSNPLLMERMARLVPFLRAEISAQRSTSAALVLEGLLNILTRLEERQARDILEQVPTVVELPGLLPIVQLRLLEKSLFGAAHFDEPKVIRQLVERMIPLVETTRGKDSIEMFQRLMEQTLRSFRRVGLKQEIEPLLNRVVRSLLPEQNMVLAKKRLGKEWPATLRTLLLVASGWYYCGKEETADKILDTARGELFTAEMSSRERTDLALIYATTLGQVDVRIALGRFEEMFQRLVKGIQVTGTTNTYYSLNLLLLVERVVLAIAHEDFTLGPSIRGWLDDDEYVVRHRIHQDMKQAISY